MDALKKYLGVLWMVIAPVSMVLLIKSALDNINSVHQGDISNPIPWIIIISIFAPIAIGFFIFGWYCWKGEFNK